MKAERQRTAGRQEDKGIRLDTEAGNLLEQKKAEAVREEQALTVWWKTA